MLGEMIQERLRRRPVGDEGEPFREPEGAEVGLTAELAGIGEKHALACLAAKHLPQGGFVLPRNPSSHG